MSGIEAAGWALAVYLGVSMAIVIFAIVVFAILIKRGMK